ncbi:PadR family transcriptional regulator [Verrucosispora sp. WMMA2044]|uniref:Helix-turn-helix transcriptional regulator n=1 Tax=Verrucosispora sioxanthis TaxID=2499994 RepID=A0A6M1L6X7_9ACTN|nr:MULTISPECIES: PadR family transcriptional regulator [Micromonospora]NEE62723.1 helix-turn-helix transcriptional regulator [Verrucosispora sioxanthis]NGM11833.1 helix-turn-helix transcriptional regulator [Verrucosispora sioxanthis]WBB47092.1 PadR family transcriptional regulator [Verrucosispora sp. WMMA2044]
MRLHRRGHGVHEGRMRGFGFPPGPPFPPGGHGFGHGRGGRGRGRGRRPNVRNAVLALLTERPMHGYEMIQEIDSRTGGSWRPSPGSIYPTLQLLEDEGVIAATEESGGGRKRFTLTEQGRAEADEAAQTPPWAEVAEDTINSWHDIRHAGMQAMQALRQVMMTGTDDQRERAAQVLDETRRKLYAILAESE